MQFNTCQDLPGPEPLPVAVDEPGKSLPLFRRGNSSKTLIKNLSEGWWWMGMPPGGGWQPLTASLFLRSLPRIRLPSPVCPLNRPEIQSRRPLRQFQRARVRDGRGPFVLFSSCNTVRACVCVCVCACGKSSERRTTHIATGRAGARACAATASTGAEENRNHIRSGEKWIL